MELKHFSLNADMNRKLLINSTVQWIESSQPAFQPPLLSSLHFFLFFFSSIHFPVSCLSTSQPNSSSHVNTENTL